MHKFLDSVLGTELVDQSLRIVSFLDDALLVVLSDGTTEFVVIHGWSVLPLSPKSGYVSRVLNLEDSLRSVQPPDAASKVLGLQQQFTQKLPEVDVLFGRRHTVSMVDGRNASAGSSTYFHFYKQKNNGSVNSMLDRCDSVCVTHRSRFS